MIVNNYETSFFCDAADLTKESEHMFSVVFKAKYSVALCCNECDFRQPVEMERPRCCPECGSLIFTHNAGRWVYKLWAVKPQDHYHTYGGGLHFDRVRFIKKTEETNDAPD